MPNHCFEVADVYHNVLIELNFDCFPLDNWVIWVRGEALYEVADNYVNKKLR